MDTPTSRDLSRPVATGSDMDYTLSLDDVAACYAAAGHPRTLRTLQRYCASGHLDSQKIATATGDKYLVTPQSVERHIAQIKELKAIPVIALRVTDGAIIYLHPDIARRFVPRAFLTAASRRQGRRGYQ